MKGFIKNSYKVALHIAEEAHKNQKDLSGKPYILHPLYVSKNVKGKKAKIVALLHDVLEDSNTEKSYLKKYFTKDICDAVDLLTRKDEDYLYYVARLKTNKLARQVKLADLKHNMDITRLKKVTEKDINRLNKYLSAYRLLTYEK